MKLQAHIALSEIPMQERSDIPAICGAPISGARWVLEEVLDGKAINLSVFTLRFCKKCMDALPELLGAEEGNRLKYLYGALSAADYQRTHRGIEEEVS